MTNQVMERIEGFLKAIGCTPVKIKDEQAKWHFEVDYPPGTPHRIHIVNPASRPEAVVIASLTNVSADHLAAFSELDDDAKSDFLWDLRVSLNKHFAEFGLRGAENERECPKQFEVTATRYEDGLTLDSFARSVSDVYKTEIAGIMVVQKHLGPRGFGAGGRFDFKRMGL